MYQDEDLSEYTGEYATPSVSQHASFGKQGEVFDRKMDMIEDAERLRVIKRDGERALEAISSGCRDESNLAILRKMMEGYLTILSESEFESNKMMAGRRIMELLKMMGVGEEKEDEGRKAPVIAIMVKGGQVTLKGGGDGDDS
jgi:hypothetical protein